MLTLRDRLTEEFSQALQSSDYEHVVNRQPLAGVGFQQAERVVAHIVHQTRKYYFGNCSCNRRVSSTMLLKRDGHSVFCSLPIELRAASHCFS